MANRRMFSLKVIDTDHFLDLPATAQVLYFHLAIRADDDGFVAAPKRVMRMIGSSDDDFRLLIAKEYVIPFEAGVCVIRHWRVHNYIQVDRHTPTFHKYELSLLNVDHDGSYTLEGEYGAIFGVSSIQGEDKPKELSPARTKRLKAKQESELPYSFEYKMRAEFSGKQCPVCGVTMDNSEYSGGKNMPSINHNVPISKGGLHEITNISIVCRSCNSSIQANETPPYNTEEVIEVWERIGNGAGMDTQVRLGKVRVGESKSKETLSPKIEYAEYVHMTEIEYGRLVERYGEEPARGMITVLDLYKGSTGKKYKDDYRAILSWVHKRYFEDNPNKRKREVTD